MTLTEFKTTSPYDFSPVDIILEWSNRAVELHYGDQEKIQISKIQTVASESVDKIVISEIDGKDQTIREMLTEASRILKKNGRLFIALGKTVGINPFSRLKAKQKSEQVMTHIEKYVRELNLLIDKNYILQDDQVLLEVVKLESDYILKKVVI